MELRHCWLLIGSRPSTDRSCWPVMHAKNQEQVRDSSCVVMPSDASASRCQYCWTSCSARVEGASPEGVGSQGFSIRFSLRQHWHSMAFTTGSFGMSSRSIGWPVSSVTETCCHLGFQFLATIEHFHLLGQLHQLPSCSCFRQGLPWDSGRCCSVADEAGLWNYHCSFKKHRCFMHASVSTLK